MNDEVYVPLEDVAKHFSVSIYTARKWAINGLIPSLKIGGVSRYKISEVEHALRGANEDDSGIVREEADGSLRIREPIGASQMALNFDLDDDI